MYDWGWPMTIKATKAFTNEVLERKGDFRPVGVNWYRHFLKRHPDLETSRSRILDQARKDATDPEVLQT